MESSPSTAAAAAAEELPREYPPFLRIYKDGTVERLVGTKTVPPDPTPSVQSKDVAYSDELSLYSRLYIPKSQIQSSNRSKSENEKNKKKKLPVLVYFHGGAFLVESAFSPTYHTYLNSIVAAANVIAVSVDYRRAPEHPLPIAYDDSWTALEWIGSHRSGSGSELWLNEYADLDSVFLAGDSAGANIAHRMAIRFGIEPIGGIGLTGLILIHPYFWGDREGALEFWKLACPTTSGGDDPWVNPAADEDLWRLGCGKVVVAVAEKDFLKERGKLYCEVLKESGWKGEVEMLEAEGEGHVFHLMDCECGNAVAMREMICCFIHG
ncbi:Probable carboxylesterase 13 [Linum perenne]